MNRKALVLLCAMIIIPCGCATKNIYPSVEASLTDINQKVTGHLLLTGIPDGFNEVQYKKAVEDICFSTPTCRTQAEGIFNTFDIKVRKLDGMFSVVLCDKNYHWKVMEDFSCNNRLVEIKNWKIGNKVPCEFELNWAIITQLHCNK